MDVVIKKEKDEDGSGSHGSWLDLAVDNRTCEWCSAPYDMRTQLPNFVKVPLDDWHKDLLLDLCYCFDCVQEYHRLQDELDDDSKKILHSVDIQRLAKTITHALNNAGEGEVLQDIATHLQVPLLEILKFPYLLHHKQLADLFTRGLIALNVCGCPLKLDDLEEKLPGTYLLLVHHDPEVRGWAVRSVRGQGLINQDDYDVLKQVIGWMIEVVEFNLFEYSDIMTSESKLFEYSSLPPHIFIQLTIKEYWLGLFVLLRQMDVDTMQSCFMSFTGHHEFLNIIVLPMENQEHVEDDGAFWPRLQCFIVLLERLGIKNIWQISVHKPDQLFTIITENYSFHNAVMHWQNNEDEEASSQEMFGDLRETRIVSGSSDTKHSSRFYKTALAWFQPFVQSVLDFDSHNDCISHVIDYLHHLADGCSHDNTFKSDVLSVLLSIIHQLLAKRKFELLLPTVCIWAIDVVDVVIFELGDKKIVEGTRRLLQHLLKDMHRRRHWRALKHWQKFSLPGPKQLSIEDQQEIVSLLVQSFQAQHKAPVSDSSCSKASLVLPYSRSKARVSFSSPVRFATKASMAHSRHGTKAEWLTKSKYEMDSKTSCQSSLQTQQTSLVKEVKVENSPSADNADCLASEDRGKAPHGKLQSYEEPGPSTRSSSSEDEETGFWACKKRDKKPKPPSGEVRISKSSRRLKGIPIYAKLQIEDCKTSVRKVKTGTSIGERAYQGTTQPKKRHRARKSAGMVKKPTPIQQNSGATLDDPIVLSDDDEDVTELPEQKEQTSTKDEGAGILDDYLYYNSSENHEVNLLQLRDEYESPPRVVETSSKVQDTFASRSLDYSSSNSEPNSSDEGLLTSYMESKTQNVTSIEPSEHHSVSQVKTEKTDFNTAYSTSLNNVLHESGDVMDYNNDSDDFAHRKARALASRAKTKPVSGNQRETVSNSSWKADLSSDSDDEPLSFVAARRASKSTQLKTSARGVVSKVKNEKILSESKIPSSDEVINTTSRDTSAHKTHFGRVETKAECSNSLFANANEITHEVDYFNNVNSDVQNHEMEIQTVKPKPAEEGEDRLSLSSISKQLENAHSIDNDSWDDYGYSELVVISQENALARVEEDLDDLYSTQIENKEENDTVKSSPSTYDTAFPDEAPPKAKLSKRVTFAENTNSADIVVGPTPSVSQAANTKPTRALSEDELFHEILNWKAERLCKLQSHKRPAILPRDNFSVGRVPNYFHSMDHYYKIFKPLLLMEIWEQASSGWRDKNLNRKCVVMDVLDGSNANSFWLIPCKGVINENQHRNAFFPLESDLVLLTVAATNERGSSNEQSNSGQSVFGCVEKADVKRIQSSRKVSVGSSGGDDDPKFHLTLTIKTTCNFRPVRNCRIRVEFLTSLLTVLRQWSGLMYLSKNILASDILRPRKADYFCSVDYSQSSHVAKEYNESQEKVISTAANAVHKPFPIPRICLVQGPPGTGKSSTIVGLVKEILNRAQEMPPPTTSGPSNGSLANKVRILLCAPSNAAIDELIVRIRKAQIQLDKRHDNKENMRRNRQNAVKSAFSNNCGDLCLVRVGRKSVIHPSVMKFSLESMTKQIVENTSTSTTEDNLNGIKEKLQSIAADEKKLQREIWMLQAQPQSNASELEKLETEKAKLIKLKNTLEQQYRREKDKQANKRREESRIRKEILQCADVICTTLSGAGSSSLKQDLAGRRVCPFTCVIVDEACQCNELDLLIPLGFQASKLVLVGDPEQLPSTVLSMKAKENLYGRSMFERLYRFFRHHKGEMGKPVLMLEEQYRMHPEIAVFPSCYVYNNCLKSHSSLENRPFPLAKHYALFDVLRGGEISQDGGALSNPAEVDLIVKLCCDLAKILHVERVGIITPYRQQKGEIQKRLQDEGLSRGEATIEVNTVDSFQGREKDVIILSCVRAQNYAGSIGFLSNRQRMNVALTRARHALYVFGHMRTLKRGSPDWKALVDDAEERHCLFPVESPQNVRSVLSIGLTNVQSPAKDPRSKTKHISAQASHVHSSSSTINDYDVQQMDTTLAVSSSGSAVERSEGQATLVSTCGKEPSITAERRAHTTAAEMATLPSNGQRDGHAAESRKMIVNSSHSTKQEQENHGKEWVRYRDRHQKETMEAPRHRPRSDDHRSDPRRYGNRDSMERERHHRQEQKSGAPVESKSNHTQREHAKYHSSHRNRDWNCDRDYVHRDRDRDRDYVHRDRDRDRDHVHRDRDRDRDRDYVHRDRDRDRDRDCERIEGGAFQERQMEPGQNKMRLDTRFPSSSPDENEVCNEGQIHCNNGLEIDTQDPHFISLIENSAAHTTEYYIKLRQQEQSSKSAASPIENGWSPAEDEFTSAEIEFSPAETTESPYETTSSRVSYLKVQPRVETPVSGASNAVASTRIEKAASQSPIPGVSDTLNPLHTRITTQHRSSTYSSAAPLPPTSNATNPNALSGRTSAASSCSLSSGPDISQPSTSSGGNRSLDRRENRSELSPDAQIASDKVRQRNPPGKGIQVIPVIFNQGSRKRKAHADTKDVTPLRQRGSSGGGGSAPSKRPAIGATKNTIREQKKKYGETYRGRKNWK